MGFICQNITHVIARGIQIANRQKLQSIHSNRKQKHLMRRPAAPNQVYLMYSSACGVKLTLVPSIMTSSQIGSTVVKAFAFQADGLRFNSPSGYKVGRPGHYKYVWMGHYETSCYKFPSLVLEDKL